MKCAGSTTHEPKQKENKTGNGGQERSLPLGANFGQEQTQKYMLSERTVLNQA